MFRVLGFWGFRVSSRSPGTLYCHFLYRRGLGPRGAHVAGPPLAQAFREGAAALFVRVYSSCGLHVRVFQKSCCGMHLHMSLTVNHSTHFTHSTVDGDSDAEQYGFNVLGRTLQSLTGSLSRAMAEIHINIHPGCRVYG